MHYSTSSILALLFALSSAGPTRAATVCNGYSEYCSRLFSNVTVVGTHDSYTASNTNLAANQDYGITQQLTDGVRMLQAQVHNQNGTLELCHTSCLLYDGGSLQDYLTKVQSFMNANPNEVVSLLLVNIDNQPISSFASVFATVGLDKISWSPPSATIETSAWPTLGSMIDAGQRLVTFVDNGANFATAPYLIDEFSNMWEGPFDIMDASGFNCTISRPSGASSSEMYLINHYLYTTSNLFGGSTPVPNKAQLPVTNAVSGAGSLGEEAGVTCPVLHSHYPTFLLVDFYDWGNGSVFQVAAQLNGVQYQAKTIAAQNGTDSNSGGSSTTSTKSWAAQGPEISAKSSIWTAVAVATCVFFGSVAMV